MKRPRFRQPAVLYWAVNAGQPFPGENREGQSRMGAIRNALWRNYYRLEHAIVPGLTNPQVLYRQLVTRFVDGRTRWLDLGCGNKLFADFTAESGPDRLAVQRSCMSIVGVDIAFEAVRDNPDIESRVVGDIQALPFRDGSFDLVTANMVVEHIESPVEMLSELYRVLARDGLFVMLTPNVSNYKISIATMTPESLKKLLISILQDRSESDVFSTYYRMNREREIDDLARLAGFRVREIKNVQGPADTVILGPLVIFELLAMRLLETERLARFRSNIIAVLQKR